VARAALPHRNRVKTLESFIFIPMEDYSDPDTSLGSDGDTDELPESLELGLSETTHSEYENSP
jgi:hypothetical protein